MTKIKDVARALRECANSEETKGGMYLLAKTSTSEHVEQWMTERPARAAIAAMRDPTEKMIEAGTVGWDAMDGSGIRPMFAPQRPYRAMIDAALSEDKP